MPNNIVFSNPGASIIRWGDGVAAPYLTLSVNGSSTLVGAAVTGTVTNTGSAAGQWSVASAPADVLVAPSSGTLAPNAFVSFTLTALAAGSKVIALSSSTPGATISGSPVSLTVTSPAPPPPPPPPAPAPSPSAAYRNGQAYLFNSIVAAVEPSRIVGGSDLNLNTVGPMRDYVDGAGWAWDNVGGDWIDSTLTRQGSAHWATMSTPAAGASAATYSASVTTALQRVRSAGRWNAWIVSRGTGGSVRTIAGRFNSTTAHRPRIDVTYTDATTATLACRVSAFLGGGSSIPDQASATYAMSTANNTGEIALEFDLPTKDITSATMYFTVTNHWGASCNLNFNLADPPLNTDPVTYGYADAYPLDAGITAHPSTIFSHRYNSGSVLSDYQYTATAIDWEQSTAWDPALTGGASDTSKLPHVGQGKWVGGFGAGTTVVSDSYTGEGFTPLAAGMGALKVVMDKAPGIADGVEGGQSGTGAANCHLFLPSAKIGARNLFIRYYLRVGNTSDTNSGGSYRATLAQRYHVLKLGAPTWTDMAGKCSIGFAHKTKFGGNSGSAGGGYGWTMRQEFGDYTNSTASPSAGGWNRAWSWTDYQNNPANHNYGSGDTPAGASLSRRFHGLAQRGGLGGNLYADRWYCIEEEIYLNSVNVSSGTGDGKNWTADGYLRCWIDGRLVYDQGNVVMRSTPVQTWSATYQPAIADLGVLSIWFNWFHGGLTQNTINRVAFVSGLVVGEARIGPMRGVGTLPTWVPSAGRVAQLTVSNGGLTNNFRSQVASTHQSFYSVAVVNDYSGSVVNPYIGTYGAVVFQGGGHSGTNDNGVTLLELGSTSCTYRRVVNPTNIFPADTARNDADPGNGTYSHDWGEYTIDGKAINNHSYGDQVIVGPGFGGSTYGTFYRLMLQSAAYAGSTIGEVPHKIDFTATTGSMNWARGGSAGSISFGSTSAFNNAPCWTEFVPSQRRIYKEVKAGTLVRWFDLDTGAYVTGSGTALTDFGTTADGGSLFFVPSRNLLIFCDSNAGTLRIRYMDVSVAQPSWVNTARTLSAAVPVDGQWSAACWCSDSNRILIGDVNGDPNSVREIEIPTSLSSTWTVTTHSFTGGDTITWAPSTTYKKWSYNPLVKAVVYLPYAQRSGDDVVFVYRPRNT